MNDLQDLAPQSFGDTLNPSDYLDASLTSKVCLICALPLAERKALESSLFSNFDNLPELALQHGFNVQDIKEHLQSCIIERDATIPIGDLINRLVTQLENFISEIDRARIFVNGERNPDSLQAYTAMIRELRMSVESLNKLNSPQKIGDRIRQQVIKPLTYMLVKSKIEKLKDLRQDVLKDIPPEQQAKVSELFTQVAKSWGDQATNLVSQNLTKLAQILGVDPRDLVI